MKPFLLFQGYWSLNHNLKAAVKAWHVRLNSGTVQENLSRLNVINILYSEQRLRYFIISRCRDIHTCSFSYRFESCWPALMKDSSGVVIIFNPDVPSHLKEIETWHSMFIASQSLQENQCLLIAHHKPGSGVEEGRLPLGISTAGLPKLLCESLSLFLA